MALPKASRPTPTAAEREPREFDPCQIDVVATPTENSDQLVDPRLVFLQRASAKLHLIETSHQNLDTAFADLVPAFREIAVPPCRCEREMLDAWDRQDKKLREQRLRDWRWRRP